MENNIRKLGVFLIGILIILIFYLSYIELYRGAELAAHPKNYRLVQEIGKIKRGTIYDYQGSIIAESTWNGQQWERNYAGGEYTAHLIGYNSPKYGSTGLEAAYNEQLLGLTGEAKLFNLMRQVSGQEQQGQNLVLTINMQLQQVAYKLLANQGGKTGAVVAIDPRTGAILAAASYPSFDVNNLEHLWGKLANNSQFPLLNRAFQGAYPPGSIMKLVTLAGALEHGSQQNKYQCTGYLKEKGVSLKDNGVHGQVSLSEALVVSCNTTFARLGLEMGARQFIATADNFAFGKEFGLPVEVRSSSGAKNIHNRQELAEATIGQGKLLVSPLHMAMVAAAIANDGVMMQPYLVQEIIDPAGKSLFRHQPADMQQATAAENANFIRDAMVTTVERGTGKKAGISGVAVAGKTGTAENEHGAPHAWFVGFAPAQQPRVAVAVIIENGGSGGAVAAPIARQLILEALR